ncbi:MAG TPA: DUF1801 domain-containing protein [Dehalococcoidia bacterium]|nr:DUF1801 domain-containing protein [Dehalococcoidia bacterium]
MNADREAALVLSLIPRGMRDTVEALRALVKEAVPEVNERPQPRTKTFNYDHHGALLAISGYQNWASIGFIRGDQLRDDGAVLEGTGAGMRHVRVARGAPLPAERIIALVRQAAELNERLGPPKGKSRAWGGGR